VASVAQPRRSRERAVARHHRCLPAALTAAPGAPSSQAGNATPPAPARARTGRIAERPRQRHAVVHQLLAEGNSVRTIAAELGLARNTVRRFARAASPEQLLVHDGTGRRPSILDEHAPYLHQRWNDGCTDAAQLWREIRARGYPGGYSRVRDYLAQYRSTTAAPAPAPQPPKVKKVTSWLMTDPHRLTAGDKAQLTAIFAALHEHIAAFADLMTKRRGRHLEQWITAADASGLPELRSFITGLLSFPRFSGHVRKLRGGSGMGRPRSARIRPGRCLLWSVTCGGSGLAGRLGGGTGRLNGPW
jgi:Homeodomain-like domain